MKNLITVILLFLSVSAFAQDKIIKKTGDVINCKVTELGADEVKYYYSGNEKLIFGIDNAKVEKVEFATGEVVVIKSDTFMDEEYYANQSKHAFKIGFLEPIFGHTSFTYEQYIKPGRSWETSLGIIGLGLDNYDLNARGAYGKVAYKMMRKPDYYMTRMHYSHILKGAYVAPELAMRIMSYDGGGYYNYNTGYYEDGDRESNFGIALTLKFGKQWVIDDGLLIDLYAGVGYGIGGDDNEGPMPFGFIAGPSEVPIAFTSGLRIGWVW
ncbi:MAG: hypothetical protein ABFR62_02270 [Bacteroidota bacterium]